VGSGAVPTLPTDDRRPTTDDRRPTTDDRRPTTDDRRPTTDDRRPTTFMGLLKHLLFWPVTGPNFLVEFALGKVQDTIREELTDDQVVKEDLLALQMRLELGEIDDDEYVALEAELMRRLREVRQWREQFGMGTSGGPVQVAREPAADDPPATGEARRGGIASPGGAAIEIGFEWDEGGERDEGR
jgi:hypothetical protein